LSQGFSAELFLPFPDVARREVSLLSTQSCLVRLVRKSVKTLSWTWSSPLTAAHRPTRLFFSLVVTVGLSCAALRDVRASRSVLLLHGVVQHPFKKGGLFSVPLFLRSRRAGVILCGSPQGLLSEPVRRTLSFFSRCQKLVENFFFWSKDMSRRFHPSPMRNHSRERFPRSRRYAILVLCAGILRGFFFFPSRSVRAALKRRVGPLSSSTPASAIFPQTARRAARMSALSFQIEQALCEALFYVFLLRGSPFTPCTSIPRLFSFLPRSKFRSASSSKRWLKLWLDRLWRGGSNIPCEVLPLI